MPDGQGGVPHSPGGIHQLVEQAHLHGGPASVSACHQSHRASVRGCRRAPAAAWGVGLGEGGRGLRHHTHRATLCELVPEKVSKAMYAFLRSKIN